MTEFYAVVPARYAATRLPGKPLREIAGEIMVAHVYARAVESGAKAVVVATDDERVADACLTRGIDVAMTSSTHRSGTDRAAEVAVQRSWSQDAIVVNVQGDEPLLPPEHIRAVAHSLSVSGQDLATLACPIGSDTEYRDPNVVKAVCDNAGRALLFSRAPLPWQRDGNDGWQHALRHIGLYAYRVRTLTRLAELEPCELEMTESLEQLRALYHGLGIQVALTKYAPPPGVDTEEDLRRVAACLSG